MTIQKKHRNKYGCTTLAVEVDTEKKRVILYHGQTAPISGDWKKTTKKEVWETFDAYAENPLYTVEEM